MIIKALIMDVDGTLTDGGIYMGSSEELFKKFNAKDGYGIYNILPKAGIIPVIITGRVSSIVENRCKELGIEECCQGSLDKVKDMMAILDKYGISLEETAYIGDDLNDYECMQMVGCKGCPRDAAMQIREICNFVACREGGRGAVREFIEWLVERQN